MELVSNLLERVHVGALAVKMHRQQSSNFVGASSAKTSLDQFGVQIQRLRIDIDEHWPRTCTHDGASRREETESGCDDGVAGADSCRHQGEPQRVRT